MTVPPSRRITSTQLRAGRASVFAFADAAAFAVLALSAVTIPATFSIAQSDVFALPKTVLTLVLATGLGAFLTVRWISTRGPIQLPRSSLALALVIFLIWNVMAAWFAINRAQAIVGERLQYQGLVTTLAYVVFFLACCTTVRTPRRRNVLLLSIGVGALFVATYAVLQRAGLDPIWPYLPYGRVFSTIGQANALAAYLVLTVPLVLGMAAGQKWPMRSAAVVAIALMLAGLALTLSRGGYLGLVTAATVFAVAAWSGRKVLNIDRRRLTVAALAVLATFGVILSVPDVQVVGQQVSARALLAADLTEGSIKGHLDMWAVGVTIAADHPVVGTGQDTYVLLFGEYRDQVLSPERAAVMSYWRPESPHNVYIAVAQGAGLPTLAAYLAVIAAVVGRILTAMRPPKDPPTLFISAALLAAIAGHLVTDTFMTAETAGSVLFWMALGAGAALTVQSRSSEMPSAGRALHPSSEERDS